MIIIDKDHKGCYASGKTNGRKYYFECGNMVSRKEAMQKAVIDIVDDHKQKAKIKRKEKMIAVESEQKRQRDIVKAEIDKRNKNKPSKPDRPDNSNKQKNK